MPLGQKILRPIIITLRETNYLDVCSPIVIIIYVKTLTIMMMTLFLFLSVLFLCCASVCNFFVFTLLHIMHTEFCCSNLYWKKHCEQVLLGDEGV